MKLLFLPIEPDAPTDSAFWVRGLAYSARVDGVAVDVVEPSPSFDSEDSFRLFQPDAIVVIIFGGNESRAKEILSKARAQRISSIVALSDLQTRDPLAFEEADAVLVPSAFASRYYAESLGLRTTVVPSWVDPDSAIAYRREPRFVTFVGPSAENGAYLFARIVDEVGQVRPDIPFLIVGTRGSGATLASSGIDVFARGTVHLMERTENPRDHWQVTRLALIPSVGWDASPRKLAEVKAQGIPVVASNRGALPEVQAGYGASLAIPDWITPATRTLPTPKEIAPWVEAIIRHWDTPQTLARDPGSGIGSGSRLSHDLMADVRLRGWLRSIIENRPKEHPFIQAPGRSRAVVLVPCFDKIERACEQSLRKLEQAGVRVVRSEGSSQIDVARNTMASDALNQGAESIFFIDADIGFNPFDALRLLARPEPVISGVYARKGRRAFASVFAPGTIEVEFGVNAPSPYPLQYAAGGFLRIKAEVLVRMIAELNLPECNADWGRRDWPFFLPLVTSTPERQNHYLGEDWAFSHRLHQIGVTPMADTTIRLWHLGRYAYGWEDAGMGPARHESYQIIIEDPRGIGDGFEG